MNVRIRSGLMGESSSSSANAGNSVTSRKSAMTQAKGVKNTTSSPKATGVSQIKQTVSKPR